MLLQMALFHSSFMAEKYSIYIHHIFHLLYPFIVDGHLGCFQVLAIVNSAAMNIRVHVIFSNYSSVHIYAQEWDCWII